jgi:hypothetical protein
MTPDQLSWLNSAGGALLGAFFAVLVFDGRRKRYLGHKKRRKKGWWLN